ncbi:MAG: ankyrin repeat domain-containing protein [Alphaproteobacteria bacterium]|nr:ankyrin repeat domain-containing protein [Alphaproteobacteria bacterium]
MTSSLFDLEARTDEQIVAGFVSTRRPAAYDASGTSLVLHCVYRGREAAARALIAAGHREGVHEAAALGDSLRLGILLDAIPSSVDTLSPDGWTALHLAAFFGRTETAQLLLRRGADAGLWSRSFERNLAIHAAAAGRGREITLLEALIAATPDIDAVQEKGYSALLIAASGGKTDWIDRLAQAGADRNRLTKDGKSVIGLTQAASRNTN